jgi:hypothetical protein
MHHPREAVIDGVQFVLIREDLLEEVKNELGEIKCAYKGSWDYKQYKKVEDLCNRLGVL